MTPPSAQPLAPGAGRPARWQVASRPLLLFGALWLLAVGALALRGLGTPLAPPISCGQLYVKIQMSAGSTLEAAAHAMREFLEAARSMPDIERADALPGAGNWLDGDPIFAAEVAITLRPPAGHAAVEHAMRELRARIGRPRGMVFEISAAANNARSLTRERYSERWHALRL